MFSAFFVYLSDDCNNINNNSNNNDDEERKNHFKFALMGEKREKEKKRLLCERENYDTEREEWKQNRNEEKKTKMTTQ